MGFSRRVRRVATKQVAASTELLRNKLFTASVGDSPGSSISYMTDGSTTTRWISNTQSPAWAMVDLTAQYKLSSIVITWAGDTTKNYSVEISNDTVNWTSLYTGSTSNINKETVTISTFIGNPTGRYLRISMNSMWNSGYGNSIWDIKAYGAYVGTAPDPVDPDPNPAGVGIFTGKTGVKIMALGDSITLGQGGESTGGYRLPLWHKLENKGWSFTPVGFNNSPPYSAGDSYYQSKFSAWGGWRVEDLMSTSNNSTNAPTGGTTVNEWTKNYAPDVILLHIGTNNMTGSEDLNSTIANIRKLFDIITTNRPNAYIFVARIINYQTYTWGKVTDYNNMLQAEVNARIAAGKRFYMVNMDAALTVPSDYADYVHPGPQGYQKMANTWFDAIVKADAAVVSASGTPTNPTNPGTRNPFYLPFSSTSPWNLPVVSGTSTYDMPSLRNNNAWINFESYSHNLYPSTNSDPLVTCVDTTAGHDNTPIQWRIPTWAKPANGTDGHLTVADPTGTKILQLFTAQWNAANNRYECGRIAIGDLKGSGLGPMNGVRAYGGCSIAGLIREWEIDPTNPKYTGSIDHTVSLAIDINQLQKNVGAWTDGWGYYYDGSVTDTVRQPGWNPGRKRDGFMKQTGYVWPATEQDWNSMVDHYYNGDIPMGAYFIIPSNVNLGSLGLKTQQGMMLAKACQDYGVYICDATIGSVSFVVEHLSGSAAKAQPFVDALLTGYDKPEGSDCKRIVGALRRVSTNNENNPNGGPLNAARRKPLSPPLV